MAISIPDPRFLFLFRLAGVMRIKNKKWEALWYGMSTSRASSIDVSYLNYYRQVKEISFRFLHSAGILCYNCFPYFLSLAKNASKQVTFGCPHLAYWFIRKNFFLTLNTYCESGFLQDGFVHPIDYFKNCTLHLFPVACFCCQQQPLHFDITE